MSVVMYVQCCASMSLLATKLNFGLGVFPSLGMYTPMLRVPLLHQKCCSLLFLSFAKLVLFYICKIGSKRHCGKETRAH